jgi:non-ribosomal peptide synthetase component F
MSSSVNLKDVEDQLSAERDYWLRKLSGELVVTSLPLDYERPGVFARHKEAVRIRVDEEVGETLAKLCGDRESLAFAVFLSALKLCLFRYNGVEDIVVGTAIHERHAEIAALNKVLVLRDRVAGAMTLRELLEEVRQTLSDAYSNQKYPFDGILRALNRGYPRNRAPLFNVVAISRGINNKGNVTHLKNDITVTFDRTEGSVMTVEYSPKLFRRRTIDLFGDHYCRALRALVTCPNSRVVDVDFLSDERRRDLLVAFNSTPQVRPKQAIHRLFEEQASISPDKIALSSGDSHITYQELEKGANQVCEELRELGVGRGGIVGISMSHSAGKLQE